MFAGGLANAALALLAVLAVFCAGIAECARRLRGFLTGKMNRGQGERQRTEMNGPLSGKLWFVVEQVILALRGFTPPVESASIALADPGFLRYYTSADWNLRRPSDGYWAGTITYTYRIASAITNAFPYAGSQTVGTETDAALNNGTNGFVITLPEDGSAASAHSFEHMVNDATRTVRAKEICGDGTVMPFNVDEDDPQSSDADGTLRSGVAVEIDTTTLAGEHKATITIHQTPTIAETNTLVHDVTTFDGCHSNTHEHNSGTVPGVFHRVRLVAPAMRHNQEDNLPPTTGIPAEECWISTGQ